MARATFAAVTVVAAGSLALPAAAGALGAAQRYADPAGSGTLCTQTSPCDIVTAINNAGSGDEVILGPGSYGTPAARISTGIFNNNAVNVHAADGKPTPTLYTQATLGLQLTNPGSTLRRLVIDYARTGGGAGAGCELAGTVENVLARTTVAAACNLRAEGGSVRNSAFVGVAAGTAGLAGVSGAWTLRGVTSYSNGTTALPVGSPASVSATNVIARGSPDITVCADLGDTATITLDHSNYATATPQACGGTESATPPGPPNQTAAPVFVNIGAGDIRQALGSPTIDAGLTDTANGTTDFEGDPRILHGQTDIGADELPFKPDATTGGASGIGKRGATVAGAVTPWDFPTAWQFRYGRTTAYRSHTAFRFLPGATSSVPVFETLAGLRPGTTYHYQLLAASSRGIAVGADRTFRTRSLTPPRATTGRASGVKRSEATLNGVVERRGLTTTFWFAYGPTKRYGLRTTELVVRPGAVRRAVLAKLKSLEPGKTFHYRLVARNFDGTAFGKDRTFRTRSK